MTTLTRELGQRAAPISGDLQAVSGRLERGELAEKLSKWVDMYGRRTLSAEPELTQTLKDIKEQAEKVEVFVRKEDKFVWVYVLLCGLLLGAVILYRRLRQVTKLHDN